MKLLAIDTATEACSAALYIDGEILSEYKIAPREHSRLILKMIDKLLAEANVTVAEIDAIAFGRGPGSFMGVRVAAGVVQGIAFAHDIPVVPISTLKTIAQRAYDQTRCNNILVAIDARMGEVYWCDYYLDNSQNIDNDENNTNTYCWLSDSEEQVIAPEKITLPERILSSDLSYVGAGTGWGSYEEQLQLAITSQTSNLQQETLLTDCLPSADVIAKLAANVFISGNTVTAAEAIPVYIRNDVAKKPKPFVL